MMPLPVVFIRVLINIIKPKAAGITAVGGINIMEWIVWPTLQMQRAKHDKGQAK